MKEELLQIGLTENEIEVYLYYLKSGRKTAAEVARELSMDKSSCYRAVENIENLGLLTKYPKMRGTEYEVSNPRILKSLIEKKKQELLDSERSIDKFIYDYLSKSTRDSFINVERGYTAHMRAMEKSLTENPEKLVREMWDLDNPIFNETGYSKYIDAFIKRRVSKGIEVKYLARFKKDKPYNVHMIPSKKYLKEIRLMPESFTNKSGFRIWSDMMEIVSFDENGEHLVMTAKDEFLASLMKNMFDFIWERSQIYENPYKN